MAPEGSLSICFFVKTYLPKLGGAEWMAHNLAMALHARGHEITVLAPRTRETGPEPKDLVVYRYKRPFSKRWGTRILLPHLFRIRRKHGMDILHAHAAYPQGYIAHTFRRLTGIPFIVAPYGTEIVRGERERSIPRLEKRICNTVPEADACVAISRYIGTELLSAGVPKERIHLIPCGVDVTFFAQAPPEKRRRPYLFMVGRMHRVKGVDILLKAWKEIYSEVPEYDLVIAGDGPMLEEYRTMAADLEISERVEFRGKVSEEEKARLYRGAVAFTCPSFMEHFGIVNIEALSAGLPVVSTRVGGIPDVIEDGTNGLLVPCGDPGALGQALRSVLSDEVLRGRLTSGALKTRERYDWSVVAEDYEKLYRDVLAGKI